MPPQFRNFDAAAFLRDNWQKKPLLIRNPWVEWNNPLEPDELAGLACESDVESRLVERTNCDWSIEHGPVPETRFGQLDRSRWTLLVQAVDQHVPEVAEILAPFRFIPNWRIDDVMVSYAVDGGGVGPHFDHYDVFLVQGLGRRRWRVGGLCDDSTPLLPHDDLRLLAEFEAEEEYVLESGDMLYLPPRYAHDGVAIGDDCMTYSIGFRAPSRSELIAAWCDDALSELVDDDRYTDPDLTLQENSGEISAKALNALQAMIAEKLLDRESFIRSFGKNTTVPRYPDADWRPDAPYELDDFAVATTLCRNPASRFSYVAQSPELTLLFVDGQCHECRNETGVLARKLCANERMVTAPGLSAPAKELLLTLCNEGSLAVEGEA